jgi:hypothetical protein
LNNRIDQSAVKHSFHGADGDFIDCVDINRQPAMLRPEMVGQKIQTPPALKPKAGPLPSNVIAAELTAITHASEVDESGQVRKCPAQTIPIRRVSMEDLKRFPSLEAWYRKSPPGFSNEISAPQALSAAGLSTDPEHDYVVMWTTVANWGAQEFLNIWNNHVDNMGEFSLAQTWVVGQQDASDEQTVEAGWQHFPAKYGDDLSRLFIYSTRDWYVSTGCYNLECGDFVQIDSSIPLGGSFSNYSSLGGPQAEMQVDWVKGSDASDWWLLIQGTWVGYYPRSLFGTMQHTADVVKWGGEIVNTQPGGTHTSTYMGSGDLAEGGFQYAAFHRHVQFVDTNYNTIDPTLSSFVSNPGCYDLADGIDDSGSSGWGHFFFYGGSTLFNPNCH